MKNRTAAVVLTVAVALGTLAGCGAQAPGSDDASSERSEALSTTTIASIAKANLGKGACSTNSQGGHAFDSSCTGNGGEPEYWCADFARWVWGAAGVGNLGGLSAAAGSFYVYGENNHTLSNTPHVGDAVVFNYHGGGSADHVAIVVQVNGNGTIETVSGDWGGQSGSEAHFSSTSHADLNAPAYAGVVGSVPGIIGMQISGFISPAGASEPSGPATCSAGGESGVCISVSTCAAKGGHHSTAGLCPGAADIECCTADAAPAPPPPPPASSPDACSKGNGYCTESLQCDNGHWIARTDDSNACTTVANVQIGCGEGDGYCTATLQCDAGHWVLRSNDPDACTSGPR
jgi:hypothetical protein